MNSSHKLIVRPYLLGMLSDEDARAFEREYFAESSVLTEVQSAEATLVADYLRGNLTPAERERFESRCAQLPTLSRKVDDCRKLMPTAQPGRMNRVPRWLMAVAAVLILFTLTGIMLYRRNRPPQAVAFAPQPRRPTPVIQAILFPGVSMGPGSPADPVRLPLNSAVRLVLRLPGEAWHLSLSVSLSKVGADGTTVSVWSAPQLIEAKTEQSLEALTITLDARLFETADYRIHVATADNQFDTNFDFRVLIQPDSGDH